LAIFDHQNFLMRKCLLAIITVLALHAGAQSTKDILVGAGFDLVKTDISKVFNKAQIGFEGHYFIVRHFAVGAGAELWTTGQRSSFMMGVRYYATENLFIRFRGLIGANEAALGVGWSHPLNESFRVEAMGDFYMVNTDFALRVGVAYIIKLKN
jgi:hypothetical protein